MTGSIDRNPNLSKELIIFYSSLRKRTDRYTLRSSIQMCNGFLTVSSSAVVPP